MYYKLNTGRIVTEIDLKLAYEIYYGRKMSDRTSTFELWLDYCNVKPMPESEITPERLIKGGAFVQAVKLWKDQHECTLAEARRECVKIRNEIQ